MLPTGYAYVVIAKKGLNGLLNESTLNGRKPPELYLLKNSLDYRVWQADEVINYCTKYITRKPQKVIVYGHSEGFNVVAKLITVNKKITHAGLWAGSAMPDYYDFMLFNRKDYLAGSVTDSATIRNIDTLLMEYRDMFSNPLDTKSEGIYTNKRWTSYAEPSLNQLLRANIPLYMVVATKDDNAPVESNYIVPLEFIRLGKTNLTFKTCVGCNHSFTVVNAAGVMQNYWNSIFTEFIAWTTSK